MNVNELYEKYKSQIYNLCIKLTGSVNSAEDLFGDTWVKVTQKCESINNDINPLSYIYTICLNVYRKSLKKSKKLNIMEFKNEEIMDFTLNNISDNENLEESILLKEDVVNLRKALYKLNDKYRIPIILFYYSNLSYKELSNIMRLPISTIKFRLNQGKKLLQKEMEGK